MNKAVVKWLDKTFYPAYKDNWDNDIFRDLTLKYITKDTVYLDAGAGRGALPQMNFKNLVEKAVGIDPDEVVLSNPYMHESHVGFVNAMPFLEDNSFDLALANNVLEHVAEPNGFFKELNRVLKPGGYFIGKTPNFWHYMPIIAHLTPLGFHKFYMRLRGTPSEDIFPTQYKINTKKDQQKLAQKHGFEIVEMNYVEGRSEYLRIFFITYIFGILYERLVTLLGLDRMKIVVFTVFRKL